MNTGQKTVVILGTFMLMCAPLKTLGDDPDADFFPFVPCTNGCVLPTNAAICCAAPQPPSPRGLQSVDSPAPSASFAALSYPVTSGIIPPDTGAAVGPNHLMVMHNTQVQVQNRSGAVQSGTLTTLSAWWAARTGAFTHGGPGDPRIVYDPSAGRWIAAALSAFGNTNSSVHIAVSATSDPTGTWYAYKTNIDTFAGPYYADFTRVGFNKDYIIVAWDLIYIPDNSHVLTEFLTIIKTNIYSGPTYPITFRPFFSTYGEGYIHIPAVSFDTGGNQVFFINEFNSNNTNGLGSLGVWSVNATNATADPQLLTNMPSGPAWISGAFDDNTLPQTNSNLKIYADDSRIQNVVYRNGSLWCTHTIFLPTNGPTHSAIQWWQLKTNGQVLQRGLIEDASGIKSYAYPSVAVNKFGDALIGFSSFSTNQYASANYAFRPFNYDPNRFQNNYLLKAGLGVYYNTGVSNSVANRWGDFSQTLVDPANDTDFWTIQEYAGTPSGTNYVSGRWGTWWGKITVPISSNDYFTNATSLAGDSGSVTTNNLRASKETGETNHAGLVGGKSIWYKWAATNNGFYFFDTIGSDFPTILAVYTGSSLTNLAPVTSDSDAAGDGTNRVSFNAVSNTTYRIAVDGYEGAVGTVVLNWSRPSLPVFVIHPANTNIVVSNNVNLVSIAVGNPSPVYRWRLFGTNLPGATNSTLAMTNVQFSQGGPYTALASNMSGSVTSLVGSLTVQDTAAATNSLLAFTNNQFHFHVSGLTGHVYNVQFTTNLNSNAVWTILTSNVVSFDVTDTNAPSAQRFYRSIFSQ